VLLRTIVRGGLVALTGWAVMLGGPAARPAAADPALDDAKAQLEKIEQQQSELGEQWSEAKLQLDQGKQKVSTLNADIATQQAKVDGLRTQAKQVALSRFQNRGVDITIQLVTAADPGIAAGLKVVCGGIVLDGTLEGLLADRSDFESRLLQRREAAA